MNDEVLGPFITDEQTKKVPVDHSTVEVKDLDLAPAYKEFFSQVLSFVEDPDGRYGSRVDLRDLLRWLEGSHANRLMGISEEEDLTDKMKEKGSKWDGVVHAFVQGCAGGISPWHAIENSDCPVALRSIAKKKIMLACAEAGRDYYYIDTGYFGNGKTKDYHRITKNAMQWLGEIEDRPPDRLDRCGVKVHKMRTGSKILICPPSEKAMKYWNLDLETWMMDTINTIKKYTDREIVIRRKQPRSVRATVDTIENALDQDIHCMVTFNSIAAVESLIYGKPVFTMGPNAAHHLANHDLSQIENPFCPDKDQVRKLLSCLAYHQFTIKEMSNGYAWAVLNGNA